MECGGGGAIVNVSSVASQHALKHHTVYCELVRCYIVARIQPAEYSVGSVYMYLHLCGVRWLRNSAPYSVYISTFTIILCTIANFH